MPFFSVITINLNNREGLRRTIRSVVSQAFSDFEYIVVDGNSSDGSIDVIQSFEMHITKSLIGKDTGVYNAMNKGLSVATGKYVVFLNSGDEFKENETLKTVHDLTFNKDFVFCDIEIFNGDIVRIGRQPNLLSTRFLLTGMICHQSIFAKRTLFESTGPFDESYKVYGDYEWILRSLWKLKASYTHVPHVLVRYEEVGLSNTTSKILQRQEKDTIQSMYFSSWLLSIYRSYRFLNDWLGNNLAR